MTIAEINEAKRNANNLITELSNVAIDAITNLNMANGELVSARASMVTMQARISELEAIPQAIPGRAATDRQTSISGGYLLQPNGLNLDATVRFLSKTSSGGLANIRAAMNDAGINAKRLRLEGSTYTPNENTLVINWGGGFETPSNLSGFNGRTLNTLQAVKIAANKLKTFEKLATLEELRGNLPKFTTTGALARSAAWGRTYVRETLFGHSGEGIQVVTTRGEIPMGHPLYVEGLNVKHEYRVHTVNGFTKIQKKARLDTENPNMDVRNLAGGWTFINEFTLGDRGRSELHDLSVKAIECLGLDFGAVDIVKTEENEWKVLEVNTAPGVTAESNIEWYSKALLSI